MNTLFRQSGHTQQLVHLQTDQPARCRFRVEEKALLKTISVRILPGPPTHLSNIGTLRPQSPLVVLSHTCWRALLIRLAQS